MGGREICRMSRKRVEIRDVRPEGFERLPDSSVAGTRVEHMPPMQLVGANLVHEPPKAPLRGCVVVALGTESASPGSAHVCAGNSIGIVAIPARRPVGR